MSVKSGNITPAEERLIKTMPRELTKSCLNTKINSLNTAENLLSSKIFFSKTSPAEGKTFRKKRYGKAIKKKNLFDLIKFIVIYYR